jgi:hypothetical protein
MRSQDHLCRAHRHAQEPLDQASGPPLPPKRHPGGAKLPPAKTSSIPPATTGHTGIPKSHWIKLVGRHWHPRGTHEVPRSSLEGTQASPRVPGSSQWASMAAQEVPMRCQDPPCKDTQHSPNKTEPVQCLPTLNPKPH